MCSPQGLSASAGHRVPRQILGFWQEGFFQLLLSEHILEELTTNFADPYFQSRLGRNQIAAAIRLFREKAFIRPIARVATHPEDDVVLATAISGKAEYVVTGDSKLQQLGRYQEVTLLNPRAFLDLLTAKQEEEAA